jgi:hypothetical protein
MFYELGGVPTSRIVEILNERHGYSIPVAETVAKKEAIFLELSVQIAAIEPVVALAPRVARVGNRWPWRAAAIAGLFIIP